MTKKKEIALDVPRTAVEADNIMKSADVVADMGVAPVKAVVPTVAANTAALAADLQKRGGVPMRVVEGTEVIRSTNNSHVNIGDGKSEVIRLKIDLEKGDK